MAGIILTWLSISRASNQDKNQRNQSGTTFSVNGAPPRSNNFTLDGAILQNSLGRSPVAGNSGDALGLDGVREFKIVAGTFQAEYGLAMGSQMVAVSKGGTNQFHGDVFEYLRNNAFDANDFFSNQNNVQSRHSERINLVEHLEARLEKTKRSSTPSTKDFGKSRESP